MTTSAEAMRKRMEARQSSLDPSNQPGFISRAGTDLRQLLGALPRAVVEMVGAPISDVWAATVSPREGSGRAPVATANLVGDIGRSMATTVGSALALQGPVGYLLDPVRDLLGGQERSLERFQGFTESIGLDSWGEWVGERDYYNQPISSFVEDIGNVAIGGAIAGRAGSAAATAARGSQVAPLSTRLRPLEGRQARVDYRRNLSDIAQTPGPGQRTAQASQVARDIVGHPYRATVRQVRGVELPSGLTIGQAARQRGAPIMDKFYETFPRISPEGRNIERSQQDLFREPARDAFQEIRRNFDRDVSIDKAQQDLRALSEFSPDDFNALTDMLPDRALGERIAGRDSLTPEQTIDALRGARELMDQGNNQVLPHWHGPEGRFRLEMTISALLEQVHGLPADSLLNTLAWQERLGPSYNSLRNVQREQRRTGMTDEQIRNTMEGSERFILDEALLDPRIDAILSEYPTDFGRLRESYRGFNDPIEQSLLQRGEIPDQGTRFRYLEEEVPRLDPEGNFSFDPSTGDFLMETQRMLDPEGNFRVERVAEVRDPVPFEGQGPSAAQGQVLRRQQRTVRGAQSAMERTRRRIDESQLEARAEIANLEKQLSRDIQDVSRQAQAAGDNPNAAALYDRLDALTEQYMNLKDGGGLTLPASMRRSLGELNVAMDEVTALAGSQALREMLDPQSNARIQSAIEGLREAQEFVDGNLERLSFFDALDATAKVNRATDRGRALEARSIRGEGRRGRQAQAQVRAARERLGRAEGDAATLFDVDAAVRKLETTTAAYLRSRQPYRENLLQRQARARVALQRAARQERSLETLERNFERAKLEAEASVSAAPAPLRDVLWLQRAVEPMKADIARMIDEGSLTPEQGNMLGRELDLIPETYEQVISNADNALRAEFDLNYVPDFIEPMPGGAPSTGAAGALVSQTPTTRRRGGGSSPLNQNFRDTLAQRLTQLRVDEFKRNFAEKMESDYGQRPQQILEADGVAPETLRQWLTEPDKLTREMRQRGYVAWEPESFLGGRTRRVSIDPETGPVWVKREIDALIRDMSKSRAWDRFLQNYWDPGTSAWKRSVLALVPRWHVNNFFGGMVMSTFRGELTFSDMADFLPIAFEAHRRHQSGYGLSTIDLQNLPLGPLGRSAGRRLERQGITELPDLDPEVSTTLFEGGLRRGDIAPPVRDLGQIAQSVRDSSPALDQAMSSSAAQTLSRFGEGVNRVVGNSYRANAFVDDMFRTTIYLAQTLRHGSSPTQALAKVIDSMGDYQRMTPFEKRYVRSAFPFYGWMRHITGLTVRSLGPESLNRTLILSNIMQIWGEPNEHEEMLPGWADGAVHLGFDDNGIPIFLTTRGINPFADVLDPLMRAGTDQISAGGTIASLHPLLQIGYEQQTGISSLTGRPFSTPTPDRDSEGRELPTPPRLREQLIRALPQATLVRDLWRGFTGDTLARYGTGEPLLMPGVESPPLWTRPIQQLGFPIRPIQTEQMQAQRVQRQYQNQTRDRNYQQRLEQHQQETGLPLLPQSIGGRS